MLDENHISEQIPSSDQNPSSDAFYRLAIVAYAPTTYHVGFYRACTLNPRIAPTVIFTDSKARKGVYVREFRERISWDISYDGFRHFFSINWSPFRALPVLHKINPGVLFHLLTRQYDAILVTGYSSATSLFVLLAAKIKRRKILLREEATLEHDSLKGGLKSHLKKFLLPKVLRKYDAVMYSSEMNRIYFQHFGVPREKLFPLLSSVDLAEINKFREKNQSSRASIREKYDMPGRDPVVLFVGRFTDRKRPEDLIRALARLRNEGHTPWGCMVGNGPLMKSLSSFAQENLNLQRVRFTGVVNTAEVRALYLVADVFVMPSSYDPSPKALNEALAFGVPAIVSEGVGTARDLVERTGCGFLYETGDVDMLTEGLRTMLSDTDRRAKMSIAALAASRRWSPDDNVRGLLKALDNVHAR